MEFFFICYRFGWNGFVVVSNVAEYYKISRRIFFVCFPLRISNNKTTNQSIENLRIVVVWPRNAAIHVHVIDVRALCMISLRYSRQYANWRAHIHNVQSSIKLTDKRNRSFCFYRMKFGVNRLNAAVIGW